MGYIVKYAQNGTVRCRRTVRFSNKRLKIAMIAIAVIITYIAFSAKELSLTDILIPGDAEVTKVAFSNFCTQVKAGESFTQAFHDACSLIIQNEIA